MNKLIRQLATADKPVNKKWGLKGRWMRDLPHKTMETESSKGRGTGCYPSPMP